MTKTTDRDLIIGNNIREMRKLLGLRRVALADKLGISHQQLQKNEIGENRVSAAKIVDLIKIFNCDPGDLLFDKVESFGSIKPTKSIVLINMFNKLCDKNKALIINLVKAILNGDVK